MSSFIEDSIGSASPAKRSTLPSIGDGNRVHTMLLPSMAIDT
jgi:hypothetical protein